MNTKRVRQKGGECKTCIKSSLILSCTWTMMSLKGEEITTRMDRVKNKSYDTASVRCGESDTKHEYAKICKNMLFNVNILQLYRQNNEQYFLLTLTENIIQTGITFLNKLIYCCNTCCINTISSRQPCFNTYFS